MKAGIDDRKENSQRGGGGSGVVSSVGMAVAVEARSASRAISQLEAAVMALLTIFCYTGSAEGVVV